MGSIWPQEARIVRSEYMMRTSREWIRYSRAVIRKEDTLIGYSQLNGWMRMCWFRGAGTTLSSFGIGGHPRQWAISSESICPETPWTSGKTHWWLAITGTRDSYNYILSKNRD